MLRTSNTGMTGTGEAGLTSQPGNTGCCSAAAGFAAANKNQRNLRSNNQYPITNFFLGCPNQEQNFLVTEHSQYVLQSYGTIYQLTLNLHHR